MALTIIGHAWNRKLLFNSDNRYTEISMPAGAFLLADLLEVPYEESYDYTTEYVQLLKNGNSVSFGNRLGFSDDIDEVRLGEGNTTVILDEGCNITSEIGTGKDVFWASGKCLPDPDLFNSIKQNTMLMLDIKVLRQSGALISRQVSWERTATDLLWQLKNNPKLSYLSGTKAIFVTFADEAGILLRGNPAAFSARLLLYSGKTEGQTREASIHKDVDTWPLKVASAVNQWLEAKDSADFLDDFSASFVLLAAAHLQAHGYPMIKDTDMINCMWPETDTSEPPDVFEIPEPTDRRIADPGYWCIMQSFQNTRLYDEAMKYVETGRFSINGLPTFTCGGLTTVDRREIEAFQNIRNLIVEYNNSDNVKPLSIAVFGAPGSGKSFGVKQIAKTLLKNVVPLEINVSQLTNPTDLAAAFHSVRDIVLESKLPLVFFDEFDSSMDGRPLGWLKSFLMPMQDGMFTDENGVHPIGKCIFVFAGGTASTFDEFANPKGSALEFKNVKAPDFISRLRGTINILGPNRMRNADDHGFVLRRALLLRSFLKNKKLVGKNGIAQVSEDIRHAMLLVPKYEHGARSMEAILDMSRMDGASFEPVSLPFYTQMKLHVDADAFIRLVLKNVILNGYLEDLAQAIHEDFLKMQKLRNLPVNENVNMPWAELSESYKNDNRCQAVDIRRKLSLIGCEFDCGDTPYDNVFGFTSEEQLFLAQEEHDRWMAQKRKDGWIYGPKRIETDEIKTHPLMLPFEKLPQEEVQKDIDAVKNILPLLRSIELRVYRIV